MNNVTVYSEKQLPYKKKFKLPRIPKLRIRERLTNLLFSTIGAKWANITVVNPNDWSDEFIMKTLKTNGFIELNRRGYFFISGFTMIELVKGRQQGGIRIGGEKEPEGKHITQVLIKHDIDSSVSENVKAINIACKVTNLQNMINYFNRL